MNLFSIKLNRRKRVVRIESNSKLAFVEWICCAVSCWHSAGPEADTATYPFVHFEQRTTYRWVDLHCIERVRVRERSDCCLVICFRIQRFVSEYRDLLFYRNPAVVVEFLVSCLVRFTTLCRSKQSSHKYTVHTTHMLAYIHAYKSHIRDRRHCQREKKKLLDKECYTKRHKSTLQRKAAKQNTMNNIIYKNNWNALVNGICIHLLLIVCWPIFNIRFNLW